MNNADITRIINKMSINLRGDGRYEARITIDSIRKGFYGSTKAEVKQKAKEYLQKIMNGYKEPKKIILNDYIEYWLETYKLNKIELSSYTRLYRVYNCQIKETIGKKMIGDVTTKDIQKLIDEYANPINNSIPLAMSGLKRIMELLKPCFRMAVKEKIISENPCDYVILPKASCIQKETKVQFSLSDDEIEEFREAAVEKYKTSGEYKSRDGLICLIILNLGLRAGEMLALEWKDIDYQKQIIHINKTIQSNNINMDKNSEKKIVAQLKKATKTNSGRILKLNEAVIYYLEELKNYDTRNGIVSNYICCTKVGTRQVYRNLERSLVRIIKRTNIEQNVTLHTLRHTFGSVLIRRGVGVEVVSKLMGHANISITYNKYIHVIQEQEVKAMEAIQIC